MRENATRMNRRDRSRSTSRDRERKINSDRKNQLDGETSEVCRRRNGTNTDISRRSRSPARNYESNKVVNDNEYSHNSASRNSDTRILSAEDDERKPTFDDLTIPEWVVNPLLRSTDKTTDKTTDKKSKKDKKKKHKKKSTKEKRSSSIENSVMSRKDSLCQIEESNVNREKSAERDRFGSKRSGFPDSRHSNHHEWGKQEEEKPPPPVIEPNYELTGALAEDVISGNIVNGIVLKWSEPVEARIPKNRWRIYVYKGDENVAIMHIHRKSAYLFGREKKVADVLLEHESCSKQHAVIQYRLYETKNEDDLIIDRSIRPYIMDLKSTHGTTLNGKKLPSSRYVELKHTDVIKFAYSTREYVILLAEEEVDQDINI